MARFDLYSVAANRRNGLSGAPAEWTDADFCVDCLVDASSVATLSIWFLFIYITNIWRFLSVAHRNDGRDADRAYLADVLVNVSMFRGFPIFFATSIKI